jgi:hypothetical protein
MKPIPNEVAAWSPVGAETAASGAGRLAAVSTIRHSAGCRCAGKGLGPAALASAAIQVSDRRYSA